jgi:L-ascorbate metabolism protein UlaG (beta-lactamase superfamily)
VILPEGAEKAEIERGSLFFIGTATVLLQYAGFTLLTDPNFLHQGEYISIGYGLHTPRRTNPAINIEQLPPLDLVLLSHMHEDHFDRLVAERLEKATPIVTTPQASLALRRKCFSQTYPLRTWETLTVLKGDNLLRITAMPAKHAPGILAAAMPQVMGSMLEFQNQMGRTTFRIYITGDTLFYEHLQEIPQHYPDVDLALLHLGGTRVLGILLTMDALQGVQALRLIDPQRAIPIHYNDYPIFRSTLDDFKQTVAEAGLGSQVRYLGHGETYTFEIPVGRR